MEQGQSVPDLLPSGFKWCLVGCGQSVTTSFSSANKQQLELPRQLMSVQQSREKNAEKNVFKVSLLWAFSTFKASKWISVVWSSLFCFSPVCTSDIWIVLLFYYLLWRVVLLHLKNRLFIIFAALQKRLLINKITRDSYGGEFMSATEIRERRSRNNGREILDEVMKCYITSANSSPHTGKHRLSAAVLCDGKTPAAKTTVDFYCQEFIVNKTCLSTILLLLLWPHRHGSAGCF